MKDEIDKAEDKCAFVRANCESDSLIDYLGAYFCLIGENLKALSISLMVRPHSKSLTSSSYLLSCSRLSS